MKHYLTLKYFNRALFLLALVGMLISSNVLWAKLKGSHIAGCEEGAGCDRVNNSEYAMVGQVPVAAIGAVGYAWLALLVFGRTTTGNEKSRQRMGFVLFFSTMVALLFTLRLEYVMLFVIKDICFFCMMSALTIASMMVLLFIEYRMTRRESLSPTAEETFDSTSLRKQRLLERNLFLGAGVVAAIIVIGIKAYYDALPPPKPLSFLQPTSVNPRDLDTPDSHAVGPRDAKVYVVEFLNYECDPCHKAEPIIHALRQKYSDKIRFIVVFKQLNIYKLADHIAATLEAVTAQNPDAFWKLHESLMSAEHLSESTLNETISSLGLDRDRIEREVKDGLYKEKLENAKKLCGLAHVHATPTLFVNSWRFGWPFSLQEIEKKIESELSNPTPPAPEPKASPPPALPATPSQPQK